MRQAQEVVRLPIHNRATNKKPQQQSLLYVPKHLQRQRQQTSHKIMRPSPYVFSPNAIEQTYANRCRQLEKVCQQLSSKELALVQLNGVTKQAKLRHSQLTEKLKVLSSNYDGNSFKMMIEMSPYDRRISDLEKQIGQDTQYFSNRHAKQEQEIQKHIKMLTQIQRKIKAIGKDVPLSLSAVIDNMKHSIVSRGSRTSNSPQPVRSNMSSPGRAIIIKKIKQRIDFQTLNLRQTKMARQKLQYTLAHRKPTNGYEQKLRKFKGSRASPQTSPTKDHQYNLSILHSKAQSKRVILEAEYKGRIYDINEKTEALNAKKARINQFSANSQMKEILQAELEELQCQLKVVEHAYLTLKTATATQFQKQSQSRQLQQQAINLQNQLEFQRQELCFIAQSSQYLQTQLVQLRQQTNSIIHKIAHPTDIILKLKTELSTYRSMSRSLTDLLYKKTQECPPGVIKQAKSPYRDISISPPKMEPSEADENEQKLELQSENAEWSANLQNIKANLQDYEQSANLAFNLQKVQLKSHIADLRKMVQRLEEQTPNSTERNLRDSRLSLELDTIEERAQEQILTENDLPIEQDEKDTLNNTVCVILSIGLLLQILCMISYML